MIRRHKHSKRFERVDDVLVHLNERHAWTWQGLSAAFGARASFAALVRQHEEEHPGQNPLSFRNFDAR